MKKLLIAGLAGVLLLSVSAREARAGSYTILNYPKATGTYANGISGNNIVGYYTDATGSHGFLYNGTTYTTVNDPLGANGTQAQGISGNNIVGSYSTDGSPAGSHGFVYNISTSSYTPWITPRPIAATLPMASAAATSLGIGE